MIVVEGSVSIFWHHSCLKSGILCAIVYQDLGNGHVFGSCVASTDEEIPDKVFDLS